MDWDYFRDSETGRFKLKRLPVISVPVKVRDVTDLSDYRSDFRGLDMQEGIETYKHCFYDQYCYDIEVDDIWERLNSASGDVLGELACFRGQFDLVPEFLEEPDVVIRLPEKLGSAAEREGLVTRVQPGSFEEWFALLEHFSQDELKQEARKLALTLGGSKAELRRRIALHIEKTPGSVPPPPLFLAGHNLKPSLQDIIDRLVRELGEALKPFPATYRSAVWDAVRADWSGEECWDIEHSMKQIADFQEEGSSDSASNFRTPAPARTVRHSQSHHQHRPKNQRQRMNLVWIVVISVILVWFLTR